MNEFELPEPIIFDWDKGNIDKNLKKHGITDNEAEEVFSNLNIIIPDEGHSKVELRYGMIGQTNSGKILFIAFTVRDDQIRIISARSADKKEGTLYEETIKKAA